MCRQSTSSESAVIPFETVESFEEILKTMDRTKNVTLVDDFAVSATYHQVKELVNRYGLICGESAE